MRAAHLLPLALAACSTSSAVDPAELIEAPESWSAPATPGAVQDEWWRSFGDARLEGFLEQVLEANQDLRAAAARVTAAAAQARIAGADLLPQVSAGLSGDRSRRNFIGLPIPGLAGDVLSTTSTTLGLSLDFAWEADLWGRLDAAEQAAVAELQAGEAELAAARLSLVAQAAKLWYQLAEVEEQARLAAELSANRAAREELLAERYRQGLGSAAAARASAGSSAAARASEVALERQAAALRRQLEVLAGRYPSGDLNPASASPELRDPVPAGLPSELITRRPDVRAAEARLRASDARLRGAEATLYPRIALTGSAGTSSTDLGDLLDLDFRVWSLAAGITAPLFQGGRLRAGVDLAESGVDESAARFVQTVLQAFADVESGLDADRLLADQAAELANASRAAQAAAELALERYRAGAGDALAALDATASSLDARRQEVSASRERIHARIDLHLALGGGFAAP